MTPPGVTTAAAAPPATRLADPVAVTLTVTGPAPLTVTLPADPAPGPAWRVTAARPPTVTPLPGGREQWAVTLTADPQVPGPAVPLVFAQAGVRAGPGAGVEPVTFPPVTVAVTTSLTADPTQLRGATGPEFPPPAPAPSGTVSPLAGVAFLPVLAAVAVLHSRFRRRPAPPPPDLAGLAAAPLSDAAFAERLSAAVRAWAGAGRLTTPELLARFVADPRADALAGVLEACDRVKFAAAAIPPADRTALARSAAGLTAGPP